MYRKEKNKRTEISELGEFGLIKHLSENIEIYNKSTIKGIGDDAAVISCGTDEILVSTDILTEGVHFDLAYTPLKHLGYKAAAVNISDIAAMNGVAEQITVSIALSNRVSLEAIDEIYEGIKLACKKYQVDFVGGDTSASAAGLFISITVIGRAKKESITYRSGAGVNDIVLVSGDLGAAYMGLLLLEREKMVYKSNPDMQPELTGYDYILQRILKPEPRTDIVKRLKEAGVVPTSMIDISDGLASDIIHICQESGKGCALYEEKFPIHPLTISMGEEFKINAVTAALSGGEDYELLFTVSPKDFEKLKNISGITPIGHITESGINIITRNGGTIPVKAQGWDAFLKNK
ncbi:MAG TPA: thiamine-phosphate kinase [Bacteroidales bacterium]|nr:thiamine-phosphate kinase [Bacteroidales bacterium]HPS16512.1 thiamine-phosphate kinase [Bacteroidales bacterium]